MAKKTHIALGILGLLLDQVIKFIVINTHLFDNGIFVFNEAFGIHKFVNQNFAWSMPVSNAYSIALMVFVMIMLIWAWARYSIHIFSLVLAGAVSNLIDRVIHGGVIDYIAVPWGGIINLADIMIFAGVVFLFYAYKNSFMRSSRH